ncbi:MAG TPA: methyltransferase domain-containing protein [bacterium]
MNSAKKFQDQFISEVKAGTKSKPLSQKIYDAFYAVPRHQFVKKYRLWGTTKWLEITAQNLEQHLATLYANQAIALYGQDKDFDSTGGQGKPSSTISMPGLVLWMLDKLKLQKGHKVLEVGAGSGWNAGLMGHIVGPKGRVVSLDVIPEMVQSARKSIQTLNLNQVEIREGDGGDGYEPKAPYDRAIFTAGAYDLPHAFYQQIKKGGLLLFVLMNKGRSNATLILFEKKVDHFQSIDSSLCDFLPMRGKYHVGGLETQPLGQILSKNRIHSIPVDKKSYWWSASGSSGEFSWQTTGLRSFLAISEPMYESIQIKKEIPSFGLFDRNKKSLAVAYPDNLISYGSTRAKNHLLKILRNWVDIGMPGVVSLKVKAFPIDRKIEPGKNEWLVKRTESQFLWSLPK